MVKWIKEDEICSGGDVGGDWQLTDSLSVRYRAEHDATRVVNVHFYGEARGHDLHEVPPFNVTRQSEYTVCDDPKDPGGTERWSDARYDVVAMRIGSGAELDRVVQSMAEKHSPEMIAWDGLAPWES